ncbi:GIY-YIG nuclease family protein [Sulfuricaulis sp.]|uniref:GIY-YIG nuclease family protein n=1 Tax=Sulfuricaulis sp. TaxID=2003553 RepID=UPI003C76B34E
MGMAFWVYILKCTDDSYDTGHTDNLEMRVAEHQAGEIPGCYTHQRRPVSLVFSQPCVTREEVLAVERQIKGWSRAKKEAMAAGNWTEVSRLSKSKVVRPSTSSGRTAK